MLKGIHPLLTADLLHALAPMGHAFYAPARNACALVRTGELRPYGNILLVKGVVNRYEPSR